MHYLRTLAAALLGILMLASVGHAMEPLTDSDMDSVTAGGWFDSAWDDFVGSSPFPDMDDSGDYFQFGDNPNLFQFGDNPNLFQFGDNPNLFEFN